MEPQGENSNDESNIISFGRRKRPAPNANERRRATSSGTVPDSAAEAAGENLKCAVGENQNSSIRSSGNDKIGSETHLLSERTQPAVIIELPESERLDISSLFTELYLKGLSLREIEQQTGAAKSVIRRRLLTNGVKLRSHIAVPFSSKKKVIGKSNIRPPYGFCYFQGQIVLDQKEYRNLLLIYKLWKSNANPNRISELLNEKNIPPRIAKFWNRNSVISILTRFENKQIVSKGGQLELR
ncbi:MAG: hypothetical protein JNM24_18830 [Bdellovibrionaceae bacterium]|nr:hypothetical protein [Pseudobdellovibrionaceae bacterium]